MLFNSLPFLLFYIAVFFVYWGVLRKHLKAQNLLLLASSYFFYGWWDVRFLALIFSSTLVDYIAGLKIGETSKESIKKRYLAISLIFNLGMLVYFKYTNFFIEEAIRASNYMGISAGTTTLNIILPVGISFYTFQTLSYTIDIYRGNLKPIKSLPDFALFVSFFPQLVAGPIERATNLIPQIIAERKFDVDRIIDGFYLTIWGFFLKVCIADKVGIYVDLVYKDLDGSNASAKLVALVLFAFQIYCDFAGYSKIARGTSRMLGIELMLNFNRPFVSTNITDFWRRWHISLSSWLKDYLFGPLAIIWRDYGNLGIASALFFTFYISGVWHGAGWQFVFYGVVHGLALVFEFLTTKQRKKVKKNTNPMLYKYGSIFLTFAFVTLSLVFFRSPSISQVMDIYSDIFNISNYNLSWSSIIFSEEFSATKMLISVGFILFLEIVQFLNQDTKIDTFFQNWKPWMRFGFYQTLIMTIVLFGEFGQEVFIYFQF